MKYLPMEIIVLNEWKLIDEHLSWIHTHIIQPSNGDLYECL